MKALKERIASLQDRQTELNERLQSGEMEQSEYDRQALYIQTKLSDNLLALVELLEA